MFFKGSWIYNKIGNLWTRWSTKEYSVQCSVRCWVETYPPSLGHIPAEMFPFWDLRGGEIWVQIRKTHTSLVTMDKLLKPVFSSTEWQPCNLVFVSLRPFVGFQPCEGRAFLPVLASRCRGQALGRSGFRSCSSWALEHRLKSCGAHAWLFLGMWDLPGLGTKSMSLELAADSLSLSH